MVIDFGNGGNIHAGVNNSGYVYMGGYLDIETDVYGNAVSASTSVSISDGSAGLKKFDVYIE